MNSAGYIYILTNPSFPDYIKIGYADDVDKRLKELNRSECIPFAFRKYATYKVTDRLSDIKVHEMIDRLNPNLRSVEIVDGKTRKREFYCMTAEDAYKMLESIASINGLKENLKREEITKEEKEDIETDRRVKLEAFKFSMCNIHEGEELEFIGDESKKCYVKDDKTVVFDGEEYSLTALAKKLGNINYPIAGTHFFKYKGEILNELRNRIQNKED